MQKLDIHRFSAAFTLVELSIVIVIIGLIVSGLVGGQSLIESSKYSQLIKEVQQYQGAYYQFRDKYDFPPGDLPTAVSYWGATVDNGGGNYKIDNEWLDVWEHLMRAEMIPKCTCTGSDNYLPLPLSLDEDVPVSRVFRDYSFWIQYMAAATGANASFAPDKDNFYIQKKYSDGWGITGYVFHGDEMKRLDDKIDDGRPYSGKMISALHGHCGDGATNRYTGGKAAGFGPWCTTALQFY